MPDYLKEFSHQFDQFTKIKYKAPKGLEDVYDRIRKITTNK